MKKKYLLLLFIFFLFPFSVLAVDDVDYTITGFKIDANIEENGNVKVCEYIKQTGSFNGYVRDLYYKDGDSTYTPTGITDIAVYDLVVGSMIKGTKFNEVDYAYSGDTLKYIVTNSTYGPSIKMFNENESGSKGYVLCYTLQNTILVHNDVAELYYNFIPSGFGELLENVSVNVYLPEKDATLRVWAHGSLIGNISIEDNGYVNYAKATIDYINPYETLNIRMTFDPNLVKYSIRNLNDNALDSILNEEEELAKEANEERERAKTILEYK